jgi:hypothetical protein
MTFLASIDFLDGWSVRVRGLLAQATYVNHLEGAFTPLINDRRIKAFRRKATEVFGDRPVYVVEPSRVTGRVIEGMSYEGSPVRRETLPAVCCIADLEGEPVPGEDGCASGLILMWFQDAPPPVPLESLIVDLLSRLDWNEHAATYWY